MTFCQEPANFFGKIFATPGEQRQGSNVMEPFATTHKSEKSEQENSPESSNSSQTPTPVSEFARREDFPGCMRGQIVDIGGYVGTVSDIVQNSVKVRSPEGRTKSFNFHTLKNLYGPREEIAPMPTFAETEKKKEEEAPQRNIITEPDFSAPIHPITEFTGRSDFPQCVFGKHVDVGGYAGVVVEIVNRSLKVRSVEERTRSYNADILKKLHPPTTSS